MSHLPALVLSTPFTVPLTSVSSSANAKIRAFCLLFKYLEKKKARRFRMYGTCISQGKQKYTCCRQSLDQLSCMLSLAANPQAAKIFERRVPVGSDEIQRRAMIRQIYSILRLLS